MQHHGWLKSLTDPAFYLKYLDIKVGLPNKLEDVNVKTLNTLEDVNVRHIFLMVMCESF